MTMEDLERSADADAIRTMFLDGKDGDESDWRRLTEEAFRADEEETEEDRYANESDRTSSSRDDRRRRDLRSSEKREMYDLFVADPEKNDVRALSTKFDATIKAVRAVLTMEQLVREAEASGRIPNREVREKENAETNRFRTWEEYQEWLDSLDEKTRNQYKDGPLGRLNRAEDFETRDTEYMDRVDEGVKEENWEEHDGLNKDGAAATGEGHGSIKESEAYPSFLAFDRDEAGEEELNELRARLAENRRLLERGSMLPRKSVPPTRLDPDYGKDTSGAYKYRTIFQDISHVDAVADQYKIMGVLDHDGTFRDPTPEELRHRFKRMTPAPMRKAAKRALNKQKRSKLI